MLDNHQATLKASSSSLHRPREYFAGASSLGATQPGENKKRTHMEVSCGQMQHVVKRRHVSDPRRISVNPQDSVYTPLSPKPIRPTRGMELRADETASKGCPAKSDAADEIISYSNVPELTESAVPSLDVTSPQSMSLPSPSASPVTTNIREQHDSRSRFYKPSESTKMRKTDVQLDTPSSQYSQAGTILELPAVLDTFDDLPQNVQSYLMYHLLKRCNKTTLQVVAGIVNPALKRDFLDLLPYELSLLVLSYLDARSLARAAQVSKRWHQIVDDDEYTWKNRLELDQYHIEDGEFERAIEEHWSSDGSPKARRLCTYMDANTGRTALGIPPHLVKNHFEEMVNGGLKQPLVGQHLYRAIYKRHHLTYHAWMNPKQEPRHISFESHGRHVVTCLHLDEDKIITGSEDANINIFDATTGLLRMSLEGHEGGVWALQYIGEILVSGSTDRTVRIWNMLTGQCLQIFEGHTSTVRCLQIVPAISGSGEDPSNLIITGSRDSTLRVWQLPEYGDLTMVTVRSPDSSLSEEHNPYFVRALLGHTQSVRAIAAHGDTLVSGSYDFSVRIWQISSGKCLWNLRGHTQKVYSVVLDTKQNRCVSGSMDCKVKIWDLDTGSCIHTLEGHTSLVGLLSLSHDRLVSAAADFTLRVWNPKSGVCIQTLAAHTGAITCFQHDGDKVISGSDGTLKLWDLKTGKFVRDLLTGLTSVWQVRFDDRRCVAAVQRNGLTFIEILDFGTEGKNATIISS